LSVLSIQSHVVYGHAGNSAAVFPLQRLGREVWAINTVEFSNHTGYKAWRGTVLGAALVEELALGLEERRVLSRCDAVLSGYLGDAAVGRAILHAVKRVRNSAPEALYCCDPVMGDLGRGFYVSPDIPGMFKNEVIPMADIITPNQFELEALTGMDTSTLKGALKAVRALHDRGPRVVLVTSFREGQSTGALLKDGEEDPGAGAGEKSGGDSGLSAAPGRASSGETMETIDMIVSEGTEAYRIGTPELFFADSAMMAGSGDLTAAVFLSKYLETRNIRCSLEHTAGSVYGILEASHRASSRELLLIEAQEELVSPGNVFKAEKLADSAV
jgi:pyridoxine kinase